MYCMIDCNILLERGNHYTCSYPTARISIEKVIW